MSDAADLRVSDQERERAVQEIQQHFAAGRLTEDELDERVQTAYRAQTQEELNTLRRDLPRLPASPAQVKAALAERRAELRKRIVQESGGGVILFGICTALWVAGGASGMFWPIWIALVCLVPLLRTTWMLYGPAPDFDRVEQELARSRRWNERHEAPLERARQQRRDARRERRHARRRF
jgi:hypothetical protein